MMFTFQVKWDVTLMKTIKKRKTPEAGTSHFKIGMKKSSKKIGEAVRLSSQIENNYAVQLTI
ncbi:hypothetical protein Goklo_022900 [Gossypium klotzschianum]|uniref:Uncharacterized protein n=1 Tax=Gossypium klotzschianum TaxID=34286 RepID=A0A7J8TP33_9ROSI|nr:hypothetical protein [Gossypium klotzschianum]